MAGVSLKCGDYGALLKSVEEAHEHAELTSHSNCPKSTKAVLNLVCTACGKPCRSKTESDLHTKQTGHTDFVDKTEEAAKPISLEVPKAAVQTDEVLVEATGNGQSEEMVVSEVDQNLLEELEGISFPKARATRALHFSALLMLRCSLISEKKKSSIDVDFFTEYGEGSRYRIEEVIGKESYGVGCSAYDAHTGEKVAIKKINDIFEHVSDATHVLREIKLLRLLRHPDIVEFKHIFVASL